MRIDFIQYQDYPIYDVAKGGAKIGEIKLVTWECDNMGKHVFRPYGRADYIEGDMLEIGAKLAELNGGSAV